jgi:ABC-type multidrug transport system fused ATPase/permease subunit
MDSVNKIYSVLTNKEKKNAILLIFLFLISAIVDSLGVVSIIPLIALVSRPDLIESNNFLNQIYIFSNLNNSQEFLFYIAIIFFFIFVFSLAIKAVAIYFQFTFTLMCEYSLGKRLLRNYMFQNYSWFLNRHSSELAKNILSTTNQVVHQALIPIFNFIAFAFSAFLIIILLCLVNLKLTLIIGIIFGIIYFIIYNLFYKKLKLLSLERTQSDKLRYGALNNAFSSIKETKLNGIEDYFIQVFSKSAKSFSKVQATALIISQLPRYIFEIIVFGGLLLVILYLIKNNQDFISVLPILSFYIFAGYRLLPALQQIYSAFTSLSFSHASIKTIHKELLFQIKINKKIEKLSFNKEISLKDISHNYSEINKSNLNKISLTIKAKDIVGFVGRTGSGKTTLVDLILGLLQPSQGTLEIDNVIINESNISSWQSNIGYVPQQIFLTSDSISSNIALGEDIKLIDQEAVEHASKLANIHDFIVNELPNKYNTEIGERGIRLSGGQCQRIGIARALYKKPKVLILDEATSALDNLTEKEVMNAINNLRKDITIILITHRLRTIKSCDQIFLMKEGSVIAAGNYKQLFENNEDFKKFVSQEI